MNIEGFIASQYKWTATTKSTARRHLVSWQGMMNGTSISEITVADFESWREGVSDSMRYNSLWSIRSYLKWAGIEHPLLKHSVKRSAPPPQPYVRLEDVCSLLEVCNTTQAKGLQDACIVAFLWETWARAEGLLSVIIDAIDIDNQEVTIANKGGGYYTAGFGPDLKGLLERWLPVRAERSWRHDRLFINIRRGTPLTYGGLRSILENLGKQIGIRVTPHDFRRGAATNFANQGGPDRLGMVQGNWLSHSMYQRYTRSVSLEGFKCKRWMN